MSKGSRREAEGRRQEPEDGKTQHKAVQDEKAGGGISSIFSKFAKKIKRVKNKKNDKEQTLPSPLAMSRQSLSFLIRHKKTILLIGLTQLVLTGIIRLFLFTQPVQAGVYVSFIVLITLLAYIWGVRHLENDEEINVRDAFYVGTAPLVKFLILLIVILLQLLPFGFGAAIFATATLGQAVGTLDVVFLALIWGVLALPSFYWITNSLLSLFVVTLPQIWPLEALRKGKRIASGNRLKLFSHIFYVMIMSLFVIVLFLIGSAFLPESMQQITIIGSTFFVVQVVQYVITALFVTPFVIVYLYKIYRILIERQDEKAGSKKEG